MEGKPVLGFATLGVFPGCRPATLRFIEESMKPIADQSDLAAGDGGPKEVAVTIFGG